MVGASILWTCFTPYLFFVALHQTKVQYIGIERIIQLKILGLKPLKILRQVYLVFTFQKNLNLVNALKEEVYSYLCMESMM